MALYFELRRHTGAFPVLPAGMGLRVACFTLITVVAETSGIASVSINPSLIVSTCVNNFVS